MNEEIKSYQNLDVYKNSYNGMLIIFKRILPTLPPEERYDLSDQLRRSSKAIPRLIAEGHSKRHQKRGFIKYLDDAHAESNETIVSLQQVNDLYFVERNKGLLTELADLYDKISRQLYNLKKSWERRYEYGVERKGETRGVKRYA
ncbi:MAG: four helix bundle protein [Candidatus Margulisiibacteriota bacterium]